MSRAHCAECNSEYHSTEAHQRAVERDRVDLLYEADVQASDDEHESTLLEKAVIVLDAAYGTMLGDGEAAYFLSGYEGKVYYEGTLFGEGDPVAERGYY